MKRLLKTFVAALSLVAISCANDNDSSGGNQNIVCPTGYIVIGNTCQLNGGGTGVVPNTGYVRYYDYNRYFIQNYNSGYGYGYSYGYTGGVQTQSGDMTITHSAGFQDFLKYAMAVCDRNVWGIDAGLSKCSNWVSGSFQLDVGIDTTSNPPRPSMTFTAYPAPSYFNYFLNIGLSMGGVAFNPLTLMQNNTFNLINNSKGFEIRGYGSYMNGGGLKLIQIQVLQGTLADGYFKYDLYFPYNGQPTKIASGRLKRR